MANFRQFVQQGRAFWERLGPLPKMLYAGATAAVLVAAVGMSGLMASGDYAVLFSGLQTEDSAAMIQKLEADRVPFRLANDGATILVPADRALKLRVSMAGGTGKGFELLDQMSIGATPFLQNTNYQRAIAGELARTIMSLDQVAHARVHLVQPEESPFIREKRPVTATVVIWTKPNQFVNRTAASGIVALVAGSVRGLSRDNVTVLDSEGKVLSEPHRNGDAHNGASSDQLAYQRDVESNLAAKAQDILSRLLGPGRSVVSVTTEMSFRSLNEESEKFDPEARAVKHESSTTSKTTTQNGGRGPAGVTSNVPPGTVGANGSPATLKHDEQIDNVYEVSKVKRTVREQQGMIDRLTVAVILIPPTRNADDDPEEALGITANEAKELVKQAVGFKEGRDQIQVSVGKATEAQIEADAAIDNQLIAGRKWQDYISMTRAGSLGIAALSGLLMVVVFLFQRRHQTPPEPEAAAVATTIPDELRDPTAIAQTLKAWLSESAPVRAA